MEYQVKSYGTVQSAHHDKDKAIAVAKRIPAHADPQVVAAEQSGTYMSWTVVWPYRGETYTN